MPPEAPLGYVYKKAEAKFRFSPPNALFYDLLRPQLVRKYRDLCNKKLCSDAFSGWLAFETPERKHEIDAEVEKATLYLYNTVIPEFAQKLVRVNLVFS